MINKVILVGNVGGDVEVKFMPNGNAVANISLATKDTWRDKQSGEKREKTEWHRVVLFGKIAEIAGEYVKQGSSLYIEGKLQTREWEKDGVKRYSTEVVVDMGGTMQMLGSKGGAGGAASDSTGEQRPKHKKESAPSADKEVTQGQHQPESDHFDDDIPF